jgi:hypothetical protein
LRVSGLVFSSASSKAVRQKLVPRLLDNRHERTAEPIQYGHQVQEAQSQPYVCDVRAPNLIYSRDLCISQHVWKQAMLRVALTQTWLRVNRLNPINRIKGSIRSYKEFEDTQKQGRERSNFQEWLKKTNANYESLTTTSEVH